MCIIEAVVLYICYRRRTRLTRALQIFFTNVPLNDMVTEENMGDIPVIANEPSSARLKVNKQLFLIDYDDLKIVEKIGEGGSNSIVYKCEWNGIFAAFKCFKIQDFLDEGDKFEEFEREASILSSVNHPNILRFYGATLKEPRVGLLMEYCSRGDLRDYLQKNEDIVYDERLRLCTEVAQGMAYLHTRKIIHRDLKPENVLIDDSRSSKIMDFGISRIIEDDNLTKTKRIGTSIYMAPEVVKGGKYSDKCDVFSFSIMTYNVLFHDFNPYSVSQEFEIEFKVANNPNYRPKMKDGVIPNWLKTLVQKCWEGEAIDRPTFEDIMRDLREKKSDKVGVKKSVEALSWGF